MAAKESNGESVRILEDGDIFFFYRPKVGETDPGGPEDVQRFHVVLHPEGADSFRNLVIGRKRLPDISPGGGGERFWGFVDADAGGADGIRKALAEEHYGTKTRGERTVPAARPAGEGVYAVVKRGDHTHLAYVLELPGSPGDPQHDLGIRESGSYVLNIKNPAKPSPRGAGRDGGGKDRDAPHFPDALREKFRDRRFAPADPPSFLDHAGAEFVLLGAKPDPEDELDIEFHPEDEDRRSAEIVEALRMKLTRPRSRALFEGRWA